MLAVALAAGSISSVLAQKPKLEEIIVTENQRKRVFYLEDQLAVLPDTAQLLKKVPGGNVNGNGPLSGIPQYRGMYGPRVGVVINGAVLAPAGPNWMDPPLSYAAPAQLVKLEVYRGIAPVSVAQESIGGAIVSDTLHGDFGSSDKFDASGTVSVSGQTVNDASLLNGMMSLANQHHHFMIAAMSEDGDDAEYDGGQILPSSFERKRAELNYRFQSGAHSLSLGYTRNDTGIAGTPALPMDIDYIDGDLFNARYQYQGSDWQIDSHLFGSSLEHGMTNYHLRTAPLNRAMWRQNTTSAENAGVKSKGNRKDSLGEWSVGIDYITETHDAFIDNPNNAAFFVDGFNDASRKVLGIFAERQQQLSSTLQTELGVRVNQVDMSADAVDATPARMMPPARALRDQFNNGGRNSSDTNIDLTAKIWLRQNSNMVYYAGVAQKTRTSSFQERYLWLPLQATSGLADGYTYIGNLDLEPEQSAEIELGFDYSSGGFSISPRAFYRDISNFIQGTPEVKPSATMFVQMMNRGNGTNMPLPLQFNNVNAEFYGMDVDWRYQFNAQWAVSGLANYVRGKRTDQADDLYRIAPANLSFALDYTAERWTAKAEIIAYADQNKVSSFNNEQATNGYELLNFGASFRVNENFRVTAGAQNLLDENYEDHLNGYNRAVNPDISLGGRIPGYGRNFFLKADYSW